jgi:hypothetical protein
MRIVEAPSRLQSAEPSLFLAGGISDCPNWQLSVCNQLRDTQLTLLNPRRENFPMGNPDAAMEQIEWEHRHLASATAILFWFPSATLCPISLYELGAWSMQKRKPLFIGTDPEYARKQDVVIQTRLARPDVRVMDTLEDLVAEVRVWLNATLTA